MVRRWRQIAYLARYAHQPYSEILNMPVLDADRLELAISELVGRENGPKRG